MITVLLPSYWYYYYYYYFFCYYCLSEQRFTKICDIDIKPYLEWPNLICRAIICNRFAINDEIGHFTCHTLEGRVSVEVSVCVCVCVCV